jgi:hypothetical protein
LCKRANVVSFISRLHNLNQSIYFSRYFTNMKTTTALLALAAAAEGSPLFSKRDDDDVFSDKGKMCKGWDLRTAEGVDNLWTKTEAGIDLELFINGHPGKHLSHDSGFKY